jgi:hypothetical protein
MVQKWLSERIGVFILLGVVGGATLAIGAFLNSDSNSRAVGAAQTNIAQTSASQNSQSLPYITEVETFDLPGQLTGIRTLPVLASVINPDIPDIHTPQVILDWGVCAMCGVGGTNAWQASYETQFAQGLALPSRLDLTTLVPEEEVIISMDALVGTSNCGVAAGFCNEARVGLSDSNQNGWTINTPHTISFGGSVAPWNDFQMIETLAPNEQGICEQAGGEYQVVNANQLGVERCVFVPANPLRPFVPLYERWFRIEVRFRVQDGNLLGTMFFADDFVGEWNLGRVSLRPWVASTRPTFWIDDRGDNLTMYCRGEECPGLPTPPVVVETNTCYGED